MVIMGYCLKYLYFKTLTKPMTMQLVFQIFGLIIIFEKN
jgi:hypothetical protein